MLPVEVKTAGQPFYLAAIAEFSALSWRPRQNFFTDGARLGVDAPSPRVPAVYTAKKTFRHYQEEEEAGPGLA